MATSQNTRLLEALRPESAPVDDRSSADLLVFAARFARLLQYYDAEDRPAGDWAGFFECEAMVRYALVAGTEIDERREQCALWLGRLHRMPPAEGGGFPVLDTLDAATVRGALETALETFRRIGSWQRSFGSWPEEHAFCERVEHVIRDTLAPCRERVRRLLAAFRPYDPHVRRPLELEVDEWNPTLWKTAATTSPDAGEANEPESWTRFVADLARCLAETGQAEKALAAVARERLAALLAAPARLHPHFALYLAFIRQLGHVQKRLNEIPRRHLDFFYREVLRENPRPGVPDRAFVALVVAPTAGPGRLPAGTRLLAPPVAGEAPTVFATETAVEFGNGEIARLALLRLRPPAPAPAPASATAPTPALTPALGADPAPAASSAQTVPPSAVPSSAPKPSPENGAVVQSMDSTMGFAVGSPCLALAGGYRSVRFVIRFREPSKAPAPATTDPSAANTRVVDLVPPPCSVVYSGPDGWAAVPADRVRVLTLKYLDAPVPQAVELTVQIHLRPGDPPLTDFDPAKSPGNFALGMPVMQVLFLQPLAAYGGDPSKVPANVAAAFATAAVGQVTLAVAVCKFAPPVIQTPAGKAAPMQPFPVFGGQPRVGGAAFIGAPELFRKTCTGLGLEIEWVQLPDPKRFPDPLRSYYREYIQVAEEAGLTEPPEAGTTESPDTSALFQANEYQVALDSLADKTWQPCPTSSGPTAGLFEVTTNGLLKPTTRIRTAAEVVLRPPSLPPQPTDYAYGPQTVTGFLRLTLVGPDYGFGHLAYPRVAAAVAQHNSQLLAGQASKGAGPQAGSTASTQDPIHVTRRLPFLERLFHPTAGAEAATLPDQLFASLRRAGPLPADLQTLVERTGLSPIRLVEHLDQLKGKFFTHLDSLDTQVADVLRLGASQVQERDRGAIQASVYGWFQRLIGQQRAIAELVQALRVVPAPTWLSRLVHLGQGATHYALPPILFQMLRSTPALPPALALAVQALKIAPTTYAALLARLEGKTFRNPEELNELVLRALKGLPHPVAAAGAPGAPDLNGLLLHTYQWFAILTKTPQPNTTPEIPNAKAVSTVLPIPNPPLTPTVGRLTLSYRAEAVLGPDTATAQGRLYQVHPLFIFPVDLTRPEAATLLPEAAPGAWLHFGLGNLRPNHALSVLVLPPAQPLPTDSDPASVPIWALYRNGRWDQTLGEAAIQDGTQGLRRPGILRIEIPAELLNNGAITASDPLWLRAGFGSPDHRLEGLQCLPHAVIARRVVESSPSTESPQPASLPAVPALPAQRLERLQVPDARIPAVLQPLPSFGGRPAETERDFHIRVSERLRHKGRAWTTWDYERLVLQEFPEVFFAECLGAESGDPDVVPGSVRVVVLPALPHAPTALPPGFTTSELAAIENALRQRTSPHVAVRVTNPSYRRVQVWAEVAFQPLDTPAALRQRLDDELRAFISPWVYRQSTVRLPERRVSRSAVAAFVESRPYVQRIGSLELRQSTTAEPTAADATDYAPAGVEAAAGRPTEHLLTADRHRLNPI